MEGFLLAVAQAAIGSAIGSTFGTFFGWGLRWKFLEKPEKEKLNRPKERRQLRKLDEVKEAAESNRPRT